MTIEVSEAIFKPGDIVFVPVRDARGQAKPEKIEIGSMVITLDTQGVTQVVYIGKNGIELPKTVFTDPWTCGEAIEVLDRHQRQVEEELKQLKEKAKRRSSKCSSS